jgi:S1-C subfamily serine protease
MGPTRARHPIGRVWAVVAALLACATLHAEDAAATENAPVPPVCGDVGSVYMAVAPAVVRVKIQTETVDPNGLTSFTQEIFSGFFISREGRVVTNIGATGKIIRVLIEKDGLQYAGEMVGADPYTKLGLVQVWKLPAQFDVIPVETRDDRVPVGTPVVAITNPLEVEASPSPGWVTGYESAFSSTVFRFTYMRVNIPIGRGEGGSPVLDMQGRLVGVTVASVPEIRSCYLVPVTPLVRIIDDLEKLHHVEYGTLPVEFVERPDDDYVTRQVVVSQVEANSSAERAGLRPDDVVRRIGTTAIHRINEVRDILFATRPGEYLPIEIERGGRRLPVFTLPVEALRDEKQPVAPPPVPPPPAQPKAPGTAAG